MSLAGLNVPNPLTQTNSAQQHNRPELATIAYRSRAVKPFSEEQLHDLMVDAQVNNRKSGLTGLLIYDEGKFFQWIEGHPDSLTGVWDAIQHDRRHTDIELIGQQPVPLRFFGDWDMRLAVRGSSRVDEFEDKSPAPATLIDNLFRRPRGMSGLQADLSPLAEDMRSRHQKASNQSTSSNEARVTDPTLRDVIETIVLPQLISRHSPRREVLLPVDLRVGELVRQLTAIDPEAGRGLIEQFYAETHSIRQLCTNLIEPAARGLGDLWGTDGCDEGDVTIGLMRLQSAMRETVSTVIPKIAAGAPAVLVVPQPGELHLLGAALDAESLYQQGWIPQAEFPSSDGALEDMVSNTWFDALDLTLSTAFRREHWLPRVAETIARVRVASRNPALVIIVGGRVFTESGEKASGLDANGSSGTSADVAPLILKSLHRLGTLS